MTFRPVLCGHKISGDTGDTRTQCHGDSNKHSTEVSSTGLLLVFKVDTGENVVRQMMGLQSIIYIMIHFGHAEPTSRRQPVPCVFYWVAVAFHRSRIIILSYSILLQFFRVDVFDIIPSLQLF